MRAAGRPVLGFLLLSVVAATVASTLSSSHWSQAGAQERPGVAEPRGEIDRLRADLLLDSEDPADRHVAVNAIEIVDGAVTAAELAADTITDLQIADDSITSLSLATGSVASAEITNGEVKTADLADASNDSSTPTGVTTAKIEDQSVTTPKLSALAVTADKLAGTDVDNAITGAVRAVTATALGDGAVTTRSLLAGSVTDDKLDPNGILADVGALEIEVAAVDARVDNLAIHGAGEVVHVGNIVGAITASDLACASCVGGVELADGAVTGTVAAVGTAPGSDVALGTITGEAAADNSAGPTGNIALKTIGADNLADGAVTTDKVTANAVSGANGANHLGNDGTGTVVAAADIDIPGSAGSHSVLVNGQTVFSCAGTCTGVLTWVLVDDGGSPVGPLRTATLGGPGDLPIFVTALDTNVASGSTGFTYSLVATYTTGDADVFTANTSDITLVDLGLS